MMESQTPLYTSVVTVIWQVGNCFSAPEQTRGMAWRIQKLIYADAHPRLNALRNGINPALDGMKVIQQVGRFTIK